MKFLPSTTDPTSFGWEDFFMLLAVVAIPPTLILFIWVIFFRKHPRRRKHRRRRSTHTALARSVELPSSSQQRETPGERNA
jgi:hypothetical protein